MSKAAKRLFVTAICPSTIQTGVGEVEVQVPKVRDRSGSGIKFNSSLLPPYLKRSRSVEEVLPWLYLKGVSTGDFGEALSALLGADASGLSASTISRLEAKWNDEHTAWQQRSLKSKLGVCLGGWRVFQHPCRRRPAVHSRLDWRSSTPGTKNCWDSKRGFVSLS